MKELPFGVMISREFKLGFLEVGERKQLLKQIRKEFGI
jgi:hypothetical protein